MTNDALDGRNNLYTLIMDWKDFDRAVEMFESMHKDGGTPIQPNGTSECQRMLIRLSLLRPVKVPIEYFKIPMRDNRLAILFVMLKLMMQEHRNEITDERANITLDTIAQGCLSIVPESLKAAATKEFYEHALRKGFPQKVFLNSDRPKELKRLAAESGLDI
ncbi:hypothetical protein P5704_026905 (plasmid) [Pseudomonas sp. FeN3W]|nr:hypothetical protein P5704_026905 [Pseudomonas sp. FeN3W]